ncbi:regulatory protein GemA [Azorhizobium caulinodans]|uniref:regulatory protein GemA n=1 Tax=Azorhizobium caulinodans TaxID=7 RepID=UPI002FBD432C
MTVATRKHISAIHVLKTQAGLADDLYRDLLEAETGKRSAKGLTEDEAVRVIKRLRVWTNPARVSAPPDRPLAKGAHRLEGEFGGVCRALWIAAYNLAVVEDRTDAALIAFVQRQTGIQHLNWVRDAADAAKVIEALKGWIARETGTTWDADKVALRAAELSSSRWRKLEVLRAQMRRLEGAGDHGPFPSREAIGAMQDTDLDRLAGQLGQRLRKALKRRG